MPPRFKSLLLISFVLALLFLLVARTETAKNYGGQTYHSLDKLIQDTGVKIDLGKQGGVDRIPFPGEDVAEAERKKHPKPADGQVEIEASQRPVEDEKDSAAPKPTAEVAIPKPAEPKPVEQKPAETKTEEPIRVVEDDGFRTNAALTAQEQFEEEHDHISE